MQQQRPATFARSHVVQVQRRMSGRQTLRFRGVMDSSSEDEFLFEPPAGWEQKTSVRSSESRDRNPFNTR